MNEERGDYAKRSTVVLGGPLALSVILNLVQMAVYPAPAQLVFVKGTYCADPGTEHATYIVRQVRFARLEQSDALVINYDYGYFVDSTLSA